MIDNIVGLASLPIGILLFLRILGITQGDTIFGMNILLIGSLTIVLLQVANIIGSHIQGEKIILGYIIHTLLLFPAIIYFLSLVMTISPNLMVILPTIMASFILSEGLYSFFF